MSYLKIKCNEYYLIKLNDASLVDKIYNYKISQYVECIYFRNVCARQRCCLRYFMNDPGECIQMMYKKIGSPNENTADLPTIPCTCFLGHLSYSKVLWFGVHSCPLCVKIFSTA